MYCLIVFLIFSGVFCKLKEQFFRVWKILPYPREFDYNFLSRGRELDKKLPGWQGFARLIKFSKGLPGGGGCIQLELTETWYFCVKVICLVAAHDIFV